jgi:hypothetical protein
MVTGPSKPRPSLQAEAGELWSAAQVVSSRTVPRGGDVAVVAAVEPAVPAVEALIPFQAPSAANPRDQRFLSMQQYQHLDQTVLVQLILHRDAGIKALRDEARYRHAIENRCHM